MKKICFHILLIAFIPAMVQGQNDEPTEAPFASFALESLASELEASGKQYLPFLNRATLRTGLYHLPAGAVDPQQPHALDEVYYVISGKASFTAGEEITKVQEGSVLFVKANLEHRFHDIEEALQIIVFFSTAEE